MYGALSMSDIEVSVVGKYRGQSLGDRVDDRRKKLLEAAFVLLGEQGAAAVTMRAVTRDAQLSPRYFYESFPDRADLLVAVFDVALQQLQERVTMAMSGASTDPVLQTRAAFSAVASVFENDPRIARILLREALADTAMRDHAYVALSGFISTTSLNLLDESWSKQTDPVMLRLDISALAGTTLSLFLDWTEGRLDITQQQLVDYLTDTVAGMVRRRQQNAPSRV